MSDSKDTQENYAVDAVRYMSISLAHEMMHGSPWPVESLVKMLRKLGLTAPLNMRKINSKWASWY